jgi:hypothetical protein
MVLKWILQLFKIGSEFLLQSCVIVITPKEVDFSNLCQTKMITCHLKRMTNKQNVFFLLYFSYTIYPDNRNIFYPKLHLLPRISIAS